MVKHIDNSGVVRRRRYLCVLAAATLALGWVASAAAQTVTASYQPFPVTGRVRPARRMFC